MYNEFETKILQAYKEGNDLGYIIESVNTTHKSIKDILLRYKEANRKGRSFTDEFKKMVAERDMNGVSRRQISIELEINVNTVKKACELFGKAFKEKAVSGNEYTRIDGKFDLKSCPSCESKKVNEVEDKTIYCKNCGDEHIIKKDHALKVNWEYLDE